MTYPTLSEVMDAVKKRDADILQMKEEIGGLKKLINLVDTGTTEDTLAINRVIKLVVRLDERVRQLEGHGKQFEKIMGV